MPTDYNTLRSGKKNIRIRYKSYSDPLHHRIRIIFRRDSDHFFAVCVSPSQPLAYPIARLGVLVQKASPCYNIPYYIRYQKECDIPKKYLTLHLYIINQHQTLVAYHFMGYTKASFLVLFICLFGITSWGQKDTIQDLPEIVITGTGTPHYLKDAPVLTEVITGKALKHFSGKTVDEVLSSLSASFSFRSSDMGSNMRLNGMSNSYILVLIDGRRTSNAVGGQTDLNAINMENIERIEIVKGAASSLYGSDAIAGVVNFITKKNHDAFRVTNTSRYASYNTYMQNNSLAWKHKEWNLKTSTHYARTDGWQNTTQEMHRGKLIENSVTRTTNPNERFKVSQSVIYTPTKNWTFKADASLYNRWTYRPTGIPQWQLKNYFYNEWALATQAEYKPQESTTLTLDVSYDNYSYFYDYTHIETTDYFLDRDRTQRIVYYPGNRVLQSSQRRWLSSLKAIFAPHAQHTISAGAEAIFETMVSPFRIKGDRASVLSVSEYAQDEWNATDNFNITTGARLVHHRAFGTAFTPKISARYKWDDFSLRATYSRGFKAPEVKELYYDNISTIMSKLKAYYGNENLRPQYSNYYSASAEYRTSQMSLSLTPYYNQITNMIMLVRIPTSAEDKFLEVTETKQYKNLTSAEIWGADFNFSYRLPYGISLSGGYSFLYPKAEYPNEDEDDRIETHFIDGSSMHKANLTSSWEKSWKKYALGISLTGRYESMRYYLRDGNTHPYMIWKINTLHTIYKKRQSQIDIHVGIDNILDYVDRRPFGYNHATSTAGRTYYISFNLKWGNSK